MQGFRVFTFADVPVMISPWYAALALLIVHQMGTAHGGIWIGALTMSLLVHEFGHALVAKRFRLGPSVLLHGLGGLCRHSEAESDRHDAMIVAAGPAAGLAFGLLLIPVAFALPDADPSARNWVYWAEVLVRDLLLLNIGWSLVNLLPIWPLDGGHLFRLGLIQIADPRRAERITHGTAIVLLAIVGLVGYQFFGGGILLFLVLFGLWQNWQALRGQVRSGAYRPQSRAAKEMVVKASEAYTAGDFREAARLCHLIRGEKNVAPKTLRATWAILGPASARLGEFEDALRFLERAPPTRDVVEAKIECFHALGDGPELKKVLSSSEFTRFVPHERREEILSIVRDGS